VKREKGTPPILFETGLHEVLGALLTELFTLRVTRFYGSEGERTQLPRMGAMKKSTRNKREQILKGLTMGDKTTSPGQHHERTLWKVPAPPCAMS